MCDPRTVLVIAAHPDDEVLGCGGTIARLSQKGHRVIAAILSEGVTSRFWSREQANPSLIEALRTSSREAAKLLGLQEISFYGLPDNRFDTIALLDIIKIVEEIIDRFHPAVIYTHHSGDLNIDHSMVCRAVLTATRPMQSQPVKEIYSFETPSSTEWAFHQYEPAFHPNVFVNIFDTLDLKIRAFSSYETEGRPFPHPRSAVAIRAIAQRWGSTVGCEAAEAFELIRGIKF